MKKLFIVAVIALMTFTLACNRKTVFELTSDPVINVPYEGGNYTITYNLESKDNDVVNAITDDKNMITSIDTQTDGYVYITISKNLATETRESSIMLSYGNLCFNVDVVQEANPGEPETPETPEEPENPENPETPEDPENPETPVEPEEPEDNYRVYIEANQLIGEYCGDSDIVDGCGLYFIILSKDGFVNGIPQPNSEYFRLDIIGSSPEDKDNIRIPNGHYSSINDGEDYTNYSVLKEGNSCYMQLNNAGEASSTKFIRVDFQVENNSIFLLAVTEDKEYNVTFDGDYTIEYYKPSDTISSITSDYEIDLSNCTGTVQKFGDYWNCGYCNWQIEFLCNDGMREGTYLSLDLLTDSNIDGSSGFEGTYTSTGFMEEDPTQPNWGEYKFIPGFRINDINNDMMGSILVEYIDGIAVEQVAFSGGEFTITDNGDGTHTIVINATDDAVPAHNITLNWTGVLQK